MARNIHQKTTEKLSDFIKYSGHHDMSKCDKMRYADLLQEGILENMTTDHGDILGIEPSILISLKI